MLLIFHAHFYEVHLLVGRIAKILIADRPTPHLHFHFLLLTHPLQLLTCYRRSWAKNEPKFSKNNKETFQVNFCEIHLTLAVTRYLVVYCVFWRVVKISMPYCLVLSSKALWSLRFPGWRPSLLNLHRTMLKTTANVWYPLSANHQSCRDLSPCKDVSTIT